MGKVSRWPLKTAEELEGDILAIEDSIKHWERMRDGREQGKESPRGTHCALCRVYAVSDPDDICNGCPIAHVSGKICCGNTPWGTASSLFLERNKDDHSRKAWHAAADNEIKFLRQVLASVREQLDMARSEQ